MKFFLAFALVLQVSGVPAVVASPCATGPEPAHQCCVRHQATLGDGVIGACGCRGTAGPQEPSTIVSVAPVSPDRAAAALVPAPPHAALARSPLGAINRLAAPIDIILSPPLLSGTGFRC